MGIDWSRIRSRLTAKKSDNIDKAPYHLMEVRETRVRTAMDRYRLGQISYEEMWSQFHKIESEIPDIPARDAWKTGFDFAFRLVMHEIDWLEKEQDGTTPFFNNGVLSGREDKEVGEPLRPVDT